jgi:hypothetical protein
MNNRFLEQFFENVILTRYEGSFDISGIKWKDHGKVDLDSWAHYFVSKVGKNYVLLFEDFPETRFLMTDYLMKLLKSTDRIVFRLLLKTANTYLI